MIKLLDFYADWCGPCKIMSPVVEAVVEELKGKLEFEKVNVDNNSAMAQKYQVMSIPTFVIEQDGKEVARKIGASSKEEFKKWVLGFAK